MTGSDPEKRLNTATGFQQIEKVTSGPEAFLSNEKRDDSETFSIGDVTLEATITESDPEVYKKLGFSFPTLKKWYILSVIFVVQCSMNFNTSIYSNAIEGLQEEFSISAQAARVGQLVFLVTYAFGCELWAPWSEELGRKPILQLSLFLVNIWQIPCALAQNFGTIVVCRFLGGLSSAGGSVTLGMVADMWEPEDQQFAVAFVVFSSVGSAVLGPIVGGFSETFLHWRWVFWLQLMFGGFTQLLHLLTVVETRSTVLMNKEADRLRKTGKNYTHIKAERIFTIAGLPVKEILTIWIRPFKMFCTEPIVLFLSLLSGFSDALIFTFLESYSPVFKQWNFSKIAVGLAFIPLVVGYFIAWFSFMPWFIRQKQKMKSGDFQPEYRLYWLLYTAPLEAIGLFGFAWTSLGPSHGIPWIAPLLFSGLVGIANYAIYMATIDYMVSIYGPYAASATGGNGFARDFLAGIAALYATPLYSNVGPSNRHLPYASTILGCLAVLVTIPIYIFYFYGPEIRARSKFALKIMSANEDRHAKHRAAAGSSA
ncbi:uncharacterized protein K452DRAFT_275302 [Aplosporella prunicola CBS 121167]|uniref:Major facilitator superfamily (MFS) profile domain-containing protein n=1 Tax=Aplosporella prunicola CBS 121167 TaxID=1176127 RepID=A0A6A6B6N3_9PEZI|nr:uncharacterized protein K452DRAFT_275302 [Aplosporella prunicola CBS 121167]KAF2139779.1 hypothetical protein K452DRAFT_275302 [Aplosporella prunicola CBS 121167]